MVGREKKKKQKKGKKMGIRFVLMVNKQGQTRLAQYYEYLTLEERRALEGEIVRKCLARNENQVLYLKTPLSHSYRKSPTLINSEQFNMQHSHPILIIDLDLHGFL